MPRRVPQRRVQAQPLRGTPAVARPVLHQRNPGRQSDRPPDRQHGAVDEPRPPAPGAADRNRAQLLHRAAVPRSGVRRTRPGRHQPEGRAPPQMADHRRAERHRAGGAGGDGGMDRQLPRQPELHRRGRPARRPAGARHRVAEPGPARRPGRTATAQRGAESRRRRAKLGRRLRAVPGRHARRGVRQRLPQAADRGVRPAPGDPHRGTVALRRQQRFPLRGPEGLPDARQPGPLRRRLHQGLDQPRLGTQPAARPLAGTAPGAARAPRRVARTTAAVGAPGPGPGRGPAPPVAATTGGAAGLRPGQAAEAAQGRARLPHQRRRRPRRAAGVRAQERQAAHRPAQRLLHLPRLSRGVPHRQPQPGRHHRRGTVGARARPERCRRCRQPGPRRASPVFPGLPAAVGRPARRPYRSADHQCHPGRRRAAHSLRTDLAVPQAARGGGPRDRPAEGRPAGRRASEEGRRRHRGQAQAAPRLAGRPGGGGRRPRTAAAGRQRPDQRPLRRTQQPGQQGRGRQRTGADRQPAGGHERALRTGQRHGRSQRRLAARRRQEPGGRRRLARGPQRRAPAAGGPGPGEERGQLHHQQHDGQRAQPAQRGLDQRCGQRLPAVPGRALPDRRRQLARRHPGRLRPLLRCRWGDGQLLPPVPATLRRHLRQHLALAARRGAEARHQPRRAAHLPARGGDPRRLLPLRRHAAGGALRTQAGDHGRGDQPVHPRPRRPAADLRPRPQPPGGDAVAERQRPRRGPPDGDAAAQQRPFRPDPGGPLGLVPPARPVGPGTRQLAGPLHPAAAHRRLQHRLRAARQQRLQPFKSRVVSGFSLPERL